MLTPVEILGAVTVAAGEGARVAVVGAVARNAWAPPRDTTDLDLAVAAVPEVVAAIETALASLGYACVRRHQVDPNDDLPDILIFRTERTGLRQVDLLLAKTPFEESVLQRAIPVELAGRRVPVATPEDLIVYKLVADRRRDRDDVRAIARTRARAGAGLDWEYVERWAGFWEVSDRLESLQAELEG